MTLIVSRRVRIPLEEFRFTFARSGGPGGQNVNKVNTKVTLHWPVRSSPSLPEDVRERFCGRYRRRINKLGEVVIQSARYRDQARNVSDCLAKLRDMLRQVAVAPKQRKPTRPTRASQERRLREKKARTQKKQARRRPANDE